MTAATTTSYQTWAEVRTAYPNQWVLIEAFQVRSEVDHLILDQLLVLEVCKNWLVAMQACNALLREAPHREVYFANTDWAELDVQEIRDRGRRVL